MSKRDKGITIHIKTTECDKLLKVAPDSQKIGEFLEWLTGERKLVVCRWETEEEADGADQIQKARASSPARPKAS